MTHVILITLAYCALLTVVAFTLLRRQHGELRAARAQLAVAEWLARHHAVRSAALLDELCRVTGASYATLWARVAPVVARRWRSTSFYAPLDLVPDELREAAKDRNALVMATWPPWYRDAAYEAETDDQRYRAVLESALCVLTSHYEGFASRTAEAAGCGRDTALAVLRETERLMNADLSVALGTVDPEEVLPSRY